MFYLANTELLAILANSIAIAIAIAIAILGKKALQY